MEFDKSKVYTALNADELKVGDKCIFANNLDSLKCKVEEGTDIRPIIQILNDSYERRFKTEVRGEYPFAYFISEPEETWIAYVCRRVCKEPYLTSCRSDRWESVKEEYGAKTKLFEGTEDEVETWYTSRKNFTDVIAAWEDGETIQLLEDSAVNWIDVVKPKWLVNTQYRVKPKGLKWTDLKIGDIIQNKSSTLTMMIVGIDYREESTTHINVGEAWLDDDDLEYWEKVE